MTDATDTDSANNEPPTHDLFGRMVHDFQNPRISNASGGDKKYTPRRHFMSDRDPAREREISNIIPLQKVVAAYANAFKKDPNGEAFQQAHAILNARLEEMASPTNGLGNPNTRERILEGMKNPGYLMPREADAAPRPIAPDTDIFAVWKHRPLTGITPDVKATIQQLQKTPEGRKTHIDYSMTAFGDLIAPYTQADPLLIAAIRQYNTAPSTAEKREEWRALFRQRLQALGAEEKVAGEMTATIELTRPAPQRQGASR